MRVIGMIIMCVVFAAQVSAQATLSATVNKNKVSVSERFQYTVTLTNGNNPKDFRSPGFQDFLVLGGPNQSSSFQSINGVVTQSISYSYILQPRNTGKFTIGASYIKVGDKTLSSQPITIEVTDGPPPTAGAQQKSSSNKPSSDAAEDVETYLRNNILIRTELSDADIYEGESFTVTLKLCIPNDGTIYGPRAFQNLKTPAYDGFYAEDIESNNEQFKTEIINGRSYRCGIIKRTVLTPQRSGNLIIDPFTIDGLFAVQVKKQRSKSGDPWQDMLNDFFSDPFGSTTREVMVPLASKTTAVTVKPLPSGAPANFNGAVGRFTMKTQISGTSTRTDEPLTYRITIQGSGNLQLFNAPQLSLPPGWETYDPKVAESSGQKTFEYLLVPRSPGKFEIPAFTWSYFDPSGKKYVTLTSDAYPVEVTPGPGYNPNASNYSANKENVEVLAEDIRYISKENPVFGKRGNGMSGGLFLLLTGLPFAGGIGLFVFTLRQRRLQSDVRAMRAAGANTQAKKRLQKAAVFLQQDQSRPFYDETVRALWGYLSDKLHITQHALSKENIRQVLTKHQVSESTISAFLQLLDDCEMSLFAPPTQHSGLQQVYDKASAMISALEKEIR